MSTIVSSFVKDRASAAQLPTASLISGAVKAWGTADAVTTPGVPVIKEAFNVTSLADNAQGNTGFNLTAVFANRNYAFVGGVRLGGYYTSTLPSVDNSTASSIAIGNWGSAGTWAPVFVDGSYMSMIATGSLA